MTIDQTPTPIFAETVTATPPLFCPENRSVWDIVRRLLIWLLRELDKAYGYQTFKKE